MRVRSFLSAVVAATIVALAAPTTAEALYPGQYILKCENGVISIYSIIGNYHGYMPGPCSWSGVKKVNVHMRVENPPVPALDPADDPVWEGLSAADWVAYIRDGMIPVDDGGSIDPAEFEGDLPTLTANEAHFDPAEG